MNSKNPLESEVIIARTREDITAALGSKYCPAHANTKLKDILKCEERFAVVGLPCHISGIRKAEMIYQKLRDRIVLHIGLFCSGNCSYLATELLIEKVGVRKDDVLSMTYRGRGWPGQIWLTLRNGREKTISNPYYRLWDCISPFLTPRYCELCPDATSEFSDISVGDAWLTELKRDHKGTSIIISRSSVGERILFLAKSKAKITITGTSRQKVEQTQLLSLKLKKRVLGAYISLDRLLGIPTPRIIPEPTSSGAAPYLAAALMHIAFYFGSKKKLRFILGHTPFSVLRTYYRTIYTFSVLC